jgi:hypothetical protein
MHSIEIFLEKLSDHERQTITSLQTPPHIQAYLDSIPYSAEERNRCPLNVLRDRQAHCLDGGLMAAAALRRIGYPPLLVDILPEAGQDDDHVLAIFQRHGRFGALAKSNFTGLRYRSPVYRSIRELVMSYFDVFFNIDGLRTLRAYTVTLDLSKMDRFDWMGSDAGADAVEEKFHGLRRFPIITGRIAAELIPLDKRSYDAGMLGSNPAGIYKPKTT